jgi:uncharacterized membrane protein YebE (DUF533 family)
MLLAPFPFTKEERLALGRAMIVCAGRDHVLSKGELEAIENLLRSDAVTDAERDAVWKMMEEPLPIHEVVGPLRRSEAAHRAVYELVLLAYADGSYGEDEREAIREVAIALALDGTWFAKLEEWFAEGQSWLERGAKLVPRE